MPSVEFSRPPDARYTGLSGLIDYAGLFPPTELDMGTAVVEYRAARSGPDSWIVDRFLCPVGRLVELAGILTSTMSPGEAPWRVSAIAGAETGLEGEVHAVDSFDSEMRGGALVEQVEVRVPAGDLAAWAARALEMFDRFVFFEIPWRIDLETALDGLVAAREETRRALGAKIRTGGHTPDDFPPPDVVAAFLLGCRHRSLPMKATAGLHHPIRHVDPSTGFTQHGFLNLLCAAALAVHGEDPATLAAVVADDDPEAFTFDRSGLRWRDHLATAADLQAARSGLFVGYGSCSFDEPVDDLTGLGVLPVGS